MSVKHT